MEIREGSTAHSLAILAMDRAEALDKATVEMQAIVRQELLNAQAVLRQEAGELQALHRKEAAALEALRQDIQNSARELKALQPGIERSAGAGMRNAVSKSMDELRRDLGEQISDSALTMGNAAQEVKGMVRRLTPLWAGLIALAGMLLGIALTYFFVSAGQRRIEEKIDRLQLAPAAASQPSQAVSPAPAAGAGRLKAHGSKQAVAPKSKPQDEPAPPAPDQP